jgi:uncharacterized protein YbcI
MRFFEYEAREIVKRAGIPVTDFGFTTDAAEARAIAERIGGPTKAKTYFNDNYVFCVLEDGLTPNEERLAREGEEQLVRQYRLRFQEVVSEELTSVVEQATGRKVLTYHSQVVFDPARLFEIFLLDKPPGDGG